MRATEPSRPMAPEEAGARERVLREIRSGIALGLLNPGQQIVEAELATALGVSRTPVREALRELEHQGLVVSYPHRGSFIRTLTAEDIEDLTHMRAAIEGMAARQAVEHASRAQLRRLEAIVDAMEHSAPAGAPTSNSEATQVVDLEFHEALVALSGNMQLLSVWQRTDPLVRILLGNYVGPAGVDSGVYVMRQAARHSQIVSAILGGDPDRAEQTVREHVLGSGLKIAAQVRQKEESRPDVGRISALTALRAAPAQPLRVEHDESAT